MQTACTWCRAQSGDHALTDPASDEVFEDIMRVLQSNFVFKGIRTAVLTQVAQRMRQEEFADGQIIVQQGDQAAAGDKMYYIQARSSSGSHA